MRNSLANRNKEKPLLRNVYNSMNAKLSGEKGTDVRSATPVMRSTTPVIEKTKPEEEKHYIRRSYILNKIDEFKQFTSTEEDRQTSQASHSSTVKAQGADQVAPLSK